MSSERNIIKVYFKGTHLVHSKTQYQYNHGMILHFADLNLPQAFEAHFANKQHGNSKTVIGSDNKVEIPDEYFWSGANEIYAWVYLHSDVDDGETVYEVRIPLVKRARPTDEEPLPEQESTINRAIAELNHAVEQTGADAEQTSADREAVTALRDEVIDLKDEAEQSAQTATAKANEASESANSASEFEQNAHDYADDAKRYAENAFSSKEIAVAKASEAEQAKEDAEQAKDDAQDARSDTIQLKQDVVGLKDDVTNLKDDVVSLKDDVIDLKEQTDTNVTHYPKIVDEYWHVWDASQNAFVNTGVDAKGEDGEDGEKGDKGDTGNSGVYIGAEEPIDEDVNVWVDTDGQPDDITGLKTVKDDLDAIQTATSEDVGKALKAKTVTDGKVTEWEFGEAGGAVETDTTLTESDVPADAKATGDEISSLKEDLNAVSGVGEQVVLTSGGYITTNIDVIDVSDITSNASYKYAVVECSHGDKYTISASTTGAKARMWCFTDAEYNVLSVASAGGSVENLVITAPANTAYLIVNAYIAGVNPNPTVSKGAGDFNGRLIPCENAVAKVQKNADSIDTLEQDMDAIKSGLVLTEVFDTHPLMLQYSMSNAGTMGSTTNKKYFGNGYNYVALTRFSGNLLMTCDESVTESYKYAFFDADKVLIGEIVTVSPAVSNAYITVPEGAKFINLQGVSTVEAMAEQARASMVVYGYAVLYPELVSRVASLESTKETTNLARLRIHPNSNNINFVVKTGLTNLYLGYGSGGYNEEDGTGAGFDNGKYNVAVGYEAFKNNETGDHSTAVGYCALRGNVSGDFNTCLGEDTMYSNTTGSNNVAIGTHALQSNNGSDNVVIGADSVRHTSDATRNKCIVIGGYINLDSDATNVIVIGQGRKSGSPDYTTITGSNKIVIGNTNHETVIIAGKIIHFNQDGTVTWEPAT